MTITQRARRWRAIVFQHGRARQFGARDVRAFRVQRTLAIMAHATTRPIGDRVEEWWRCTARLHLDVAKEMRWWGRPRSARHALRLAREARIYAIEARRRLTRQEAS